MGLFEDLDEGNNGKLMATIKDKPGRYLQTIDDISIAKTQDGVEFVRISKTIDKVIADTEGMAHPEGEEVSEALFKKFNYLERDLRNVARIGFGLTVAEANKMSFKEIKKRLIIDKQLNGEQIEVDVRTGGIGEKGPWAKVQWLKNVSLASRGGEAAESESAEEEAPAPKSRAKKKTAKKKR